MSALIGRLETHCKVIEFALAGNARLTLVSKTTGARFTYRIRKPDPSAPYFVSILSGSNNDIDYKFIGTLFTQNANGVPHFAVGRRSRIDPTLQCVKAFAWFWRNIANGRLPPIVEVWHEGRCGRCGRPLTVPESVARGIGPECAAKEPRSRGAQIDWVPHEGFRT